MPPPEWFGRFNRRVTNRITLRFASRAPGFAVVVHRGRKSGRLYWTPVNVFPRPDGYVITLDRTDSDWVKNVLAGGGCEPAYRGRLERVNSPRIVHDETRHFVPPILRLVGRLFGAADFLYLKHEAASSPPGATSAGRDSLMSSTSTASASPGCAPRTANGPVTGFPRPTGGPRQANDLADRVDEREAAGCVLGIEDDGCARVDGQHRRRAGS